MTVRDYCDVKFSVRAYCEFATNEKHAAAARGGGMKCEPTTPCSIAEGQMPEKHVNHVLQMMTKTKGVDEISDAEVVVEYYTSTTESTVDDRIYCTYRIYVNYRNATEM
ncbi:hypothetical protein BASA60_010060, partial [Batrachochytrium salamandrivorans]